MPAMGNNRGVAAAVGAPDGLRQRMGIRRSCGLGQGFEGDGVAEGFQAGDEAFDEAFGVVALERLR